MIVPAEVNQFNDDHGIRDRVAVYVGDRSRNRFGQFDHPDGEPIIARASFALGIRSKSSRV